ncbi:MAG: hypothetical protein NUV91_08635 [Candidatus Omnitrophica bacterium]|nr:hypothetical protein [Candidatus Omnitrophota bacterium]
MKEGLINVFKFILAVALLPVVIAVTCGFFNELPALQNFEHFFQAGLIAYVIIHLFVFTPESLYQFGQRVLGEMVPLIFIGRVIPVVPLLLVLILYILETFFNFTDLKSYFVFFFAFTLAMHVIMTSQQLYDEDSSILKGHYLSTAGFVYVCNLALVAFLLHLNFPDFSFVDFWNTSFEKGKDIVLPIYDRIVKR